MKTMLLLKKLDETEKKFAVPDLYNEAFNIIFDKKISKKLFEKSKEINYFGRTELLHELKKLDEKSLKEIADKIEYCRMRDSVETLNDFENCLIKENTPYELTKIATMYVLRVLQESYDQYEELSEVIE